MEHQAAGLLTIMTPSRNSIPTSLAERPGHIPIKPDTSCVLVGNGPSLIASGLGQVIDGHDEVVRFNTFHIKGFENHVGSKTTLWATFGRGTLPFDEDIRPKRMILTHWNALPCYTPDEIHRIDHKFFTEVRELAKSKTKRVDDAREKLIPTSGLLVAFWLLNVVGLKRLKLAGFDHFSKKHSSYHHYWMPKAFGKPPEHDGDAEAELMKEMMDAGRVEYLVPK